MLPYKDFSLDGIPLLNTAQTSLIPALASPLMGAGRPNDIFRSGIGTIGTYRSTALRLHEKTIKRRNEY
jgi:hypothetical protein